tara:strand:+ start:1869 stop:2006 length:138 start_codon:yes stop_codon:yes gene_type:complete
MYLVRKKYKWIVYDDSGKIVVICTNKKVAIAYAKEIKESNRWIIT